MAKKKATKKVKATPKKKAGTKKVTKKAKAKKPKAAKRAAAADKKTSTRASVKPTTRKLNSWVTSGSDIALASMEADGIFDKADALNPDEGLHAGDSPDEEGALETHSFDSEDDDLDL